MYSLERGNREEFYLRLEERRVFKNLGENGSESIVVAWLKN